MFDYLAQVVRNRIIDENEAHFTRDERNLLSHAFKNMIVPKRYTWRHLNSQLKVPIGESTQSAIEKYRASIEARMHQQCMSIVNLMRDEFLPALEGNIKKNRLQLDDAYIEERAFFYKIVGDYFRYASEATTVDASSQSFKSSVPSAAENLPDMDGSAKREFFKQGALDAYTKCSNFSRRGLKPYNCVRLGLALNFSVFQYEIMQDA